MYKSLKKKILAHTCPKQRHHRHNIFSHLPPIISSLSNTRALYEYRPLFFITLFAKVSGCHVLCRLVHSIQLKLVVV
jgi:hypothetical protein